MGFLAAAGNIENDIRDLKTDRINRPKRPLISQNITQRKARVVMGCMYVLGVLSALMYSLPHAGLAIITALLLTLYNSQLKSWPLIGNLAIAILCTLPIWFVEFPFWPHQTWVPIVFAFLTTLVREVLKDMEDLKGDSQTGRVSLPMIFGENKSAWLCLLLLIIVILASPLPWLFFNYTSMYLFLNLILVLPGVAWAGYDIIFLKNWSLSQKKIKWVMLGGMVAIAMGSLGRF